MARIERQSRYQQIGIFVATLMVASTLGVVVTGFVSVSARPATEPSLAGSNPAQGSILVSASTASPRAASPIASVGPDDVVPGSAPSVGDGNDWYADAPGGSVIGVVTGSFPAEAGITGEVSAVGPGGGPNCAVGTSNCYGLQINTNSFNTTYASSGGPIATTGSEQYVYQDGGSSAIMGIWVILYGFSSCPSPSPAGYSSWDLDLGNCYAHSPFVAVPPVPVTDFPAVTMTAYANQSGNDSLVFCVNPAISGWPVCTATSASDAIGLSEAWTVAEFNVFGDNGGSQAAFNGGAALQVQTQIAAEGGSAIVPSCAGAPGVHTVEDNNLYLWPCGASSSGILFWEANESFGLSPAPASATVQAGQTASYALGFSSFAGVPAPVQLSVVSPLPPGVTPSASSPVTPPGPAVLTLATSPFTPLGDYAVTVQAQIAGLAGGPIATTTVALHIFNFTVSISPASQTVLRGLAATYDVQLSLDAGSTLVGLPAIVLTEPGLPGDSIVSGLDPAGYVLSSPAPLAVPLGVQTAPAPSGSLGDFPFTVTGAATGYPSGASSAGAVLHIYDYSVAVIPSGQTVLRGADPALYYLDLSLLPGSSSVGVPAETIVVSGLPAGTPSPTLSAATITPTFAGCAPPLCPTLTVTTAGPPSGPLGDSTFSVMGVDPTSGGVRSSTGGLHIFDFVAAPTPAESLFQGESITVTIGLPLDPGSTSVGLPIVSLSLTGLPTGVVELGFPASLVAGGSHTFTLETSSVGAYVSCPAVSNRGGQNLQSANLAHCELAGYDLKGDNLQRANLSGANLSNADLAGDNLQDANLSSANTSGADFQGSNMQYVDLTAPGRIGTFTLTVTATVDGGTRVGHSTLTVWGDPISGDDFAGDNLQYADLAGDLGVAADFGGDNLQYANLAVSDVQAADFQGDNLQYVDLAAGDVQGADFQGDNLQDADLAGAWLTGLGPLASQLTNFNGANLQGALLAGAICGSPNYITANGANTHGLMDVPSGCTPPLDPPPALSPALVGMLGSQLLSPAVAWCVVFVAEALVGILGALAIEGRLRRRP
jgi:uncharacterized protein YjbI with pentapeptide repeats